MDNIANKHRLKSLKSLLRKVQLLIPKNEEDLYVYLLSNGLTLITEHKFLPEYSDFYQAREELMFAGKKEEIIEQIRYFIYEIEYYS